MRGSGLSAKRPRVGVPESVDALIEAIADRVVQRLLAEVPSEAEFEELRQDVAELGRLVRAADGRPPKKAGRPRRHRLCKLPGCASPHVAHGLCSRHYQRWRRRNLRDSVTGTESPASLGHDRPLDH